MSTATADKVNDFKIVFTGPVGAGKSTAIHSISDEPPIMTEAAASDMTQGRKPTTTVAMDYGIMKLSDTEKIHLYGTPGQERFSFMWDILTEGGLGLIMLLDNTRSNPFQDIKFFLESFHDFIYTTKVAIGVTRMDLQSTPTIEDYHQQLHGSGLKPPIFEVDARETKDVSVLVRSLLYALDPGLAET